jgi:hypothetical protein
LKPSTAHLNKAPPATLSTCKSLCTSTCVNQLDDADYYMEANILFLCLFIGILGFIVYKFILPCLENGRRASPPRSRPPSGPGSGSGWFSGNFYDDFRRPPPPYTKHPNTNTGTGSTPQVRGDQERFGFWSGAALGGLGTYLLTRQRNSGSEPTGRRYDWENDRLRDYSRRDPDPQAPRASGAFSSQQSWSDGRAGPSNLGSMRRSTGFGGSTVR